MKDPQLLAMLFTKIPLQYPMTPRKHSNSYT